MNDERKDSFGCDWPSMAPPAGRWVSFDHVSVWGSELSVLSHHHTPAAAVAVACYLWKNTKECQKYRL